MFVASRSLFAGCKHHIRNPRTGSPHIPVTFPTSIGESIYVHPTALRNFIVNYLPRLRFHFVLVSGDSDLTIPNDVQAEADFLLKHPLLIRWYSQNCVKPSEKLLQLPIGLDFHTLSERAMEWGPKQSVEEQVAGLIAIPNNSPKQTKCYANFQFLMNTRYAQDRLDAIAQIPKDLVFYEPTKIPRIQTWMAMTTYKYVISPHGNGLDCHRTWEALVLGCIPIVKTSPLDSLFAGLPILIVKEWSDVTQELLNAFEPIRNVEKLSLSYWLSRINK